VIPEQVIDAALIHDEHHEIDRFHANLRPEAAFMERQIGGRAPAVRRTAADEPFAILAAHDERALLCSRDDRDAPGTPPGVLRDASIRD